MKTELSFLLFLYIYLIYYWARDLFENYYISNNNSNNPFISLEKKGTWTNQKMYIQNTNTHTTDPTISIGIHGHSTPLLNISKANGLILSKKDGSHTHFDADNGDNYIRGGTHFEDNTYFKGTSNINKLNMTGKLHFMKSKNIDNSNKKDYNKKNNEIHMICPSGKIMVGINLITNKDEKSIVPICK